MNSENHLEIDSQKTLIKQCHVCNHVMESQKEVEKCGKCNKPFLPLNYFQKVHAKNSEDFKELFSSAFALHQEDLIKGLYVIW